jgi:hypothetical protein
LLKTELRRAKKDAATSAAINETIFVKKPPQKRKREKTTEYNARMKAWREKGDRAMDSLFENNPNMKDEDKKTIKTVFETEGAEAAVQKTKELGYSFSDLEDQQKLAEI